MGRKIKAVKRHPAKRQVSRRPRSVSVLPPPLPFGRTALHGVLRIASADVMNINTLLRKTISWSEILVEMWANLRTMFSEMKLSRIRVWTMPGVATTAMGLQCLIVCPANEFQPVKDPKFVHLGSVPGAIVRKVYQACYREWRPTSPVEKGWHRTDSTDGLFTFIYMTNGMKTGNGIDGSSFLLETVIDVHIKARGLGGNSFVGGDFGPLLTSKIVEPEVSVATPTQPSVRLSSMCLDDSN